MWRIKLSLIGTDTIITARGFSFWLRHWRVVLIIGTGLTVLKVVFVEFLADLYMIGIVGMILDTAYATIIGTRRSDTVIIRSTCAKSRIGKQFRFVGEKSFSGLITRIRYWSRGITGCRSVFLGRASQKP